MISVSIPSTTHSSANGTTHASRVRTGAAKCARADLSSSSKCARRSSAHLASGTHRQPRHPARELAGDARSPQQQVHHQRDRRREHDAAEREQRGRRRRDVAAREQPDADHQQVERVGTDQHQLGQRQARGAGGDRHAGALAQQAHLRRLARDRSARQRQHDRLDGQPQLHHPPPRHRVPECPQDRLPAQRVQHHRDQRREHDEHQRPAAVPDLRPGPLQILPRHQLAEADQDDDDQQPAEPWTQSPHPPPGRWYHGCGDFGGFGAFTDRARGHAAPPGPR